MAGEVLGRRALNRALLERQLLLRRGDVPVREAVERLVGLQAQAPMPPYLGLFARIEGFDPDELGRMLLDREAVRLTLMRATVHLVSAEDAIWLWPLTRVVTERTYDGRLGDVDRSELAAVARELLAANPLSARELGRALVERGLGDDPDALGVGVRAHVPLLQVPPRGVWGSGGQARLAALEEWTGRELEREPSIEAMVLRYLAGFGPASAMDFQNWSGLTRIKDVVERLRPRLVPFRGEDGRELFDLPDAPRPDPDFPAPVRLLGEFDNVLLGHADRRRIVPEGIRPSTALGQGRSVNTMLIDGELRAVWWIERNRRRATLAIRPLLDKLSHRVRGDVAEEALNVLDFAAADAEVRDLRFEAPL